MTLEDVNALMRSWDMSPPACISLAALASAFGPKRATLAPASPSTAAPPELPSIAEVQAMIASLPSR